MRKQLEPAAHHFLGKLIILAPPMLAAKRMMPPLLNAPNASPLPKMQNKADSKLISGLTFDVRGLSALSKKL